MKRLVVLGALGLLASCGSELNDSKLNSIAPTDTPAEVEFVIPAGTGENSWNSQETMVNVVVGDVLMIRNDDDVTHQLHTFGAPCSHGSAIEPGETWNCNISRAYNPDSDRPIYDHIVGRSARFWLRATDPVKQNQLVENIDLDTVYEQGAIGIAIPDNAGAIAHEFPIEATGFIDEIQVHVKITHTYIGDLNIKIVSPDGTTVILHDRTGGSTDDIDILYGPGGQEIEALSNMSGKEIYGNWKLVVQDMARADLGTVNYVKIGMSRTFR